MVDGGEGLSRSRPMRLVDPTQRRKLKDSPPPSPLALFRGEEAKLEATLALNAPLAAAYYLKEDLRQFWQQPDKAEGRTFLEGWIERARATQIPQLVTMSTP